MRFSKVELYPLVCLTAPRCLPPAVRESRLARFCKKVYFRFIFGIMLHGPTPHSQIIEPEI